ncbi:hypothetical protein [Parasphingorhabdus halotolerans]|uniref:IclR helix-turn-helix domain-containing protein n=1 Tax=Parasphingorhabdus halotolerans TaxID=2725558 RepID=A0A6H2DJ69_9SPHN|nr:hypothetical protein [Parasphingorhabdus halotolerans]QJB68033.1 hypothetical protein HF685_00850 [Parasphingorhabdus halotolerans]
MRMNKISEEVIEIKSSLKKVMVKLKALEELITVNEKSGVEEKTAKKLGTGELIERARKNLRWSRSKVQAMDSGYGLFSDACWNMCLDIYICNLNREPITVSSIAHSSGIPMTTAMRYINVMVKQGLLIKTPNPSDNRMFLVSMSMDSIERTTNVLISYPG